VPHGTALRPFPTEAEASKKVSPLIKLTAPAVSGRAYEVYDNIKVDFINLRVSSPFHGIMNPES
jgi:hypothetical protein